MDSKLPVDRIENATIFVSGYLNGFAQIEVRYISFHVVFPKGQRSFEAASYVKRGKRKEETIEANHVVVISGCGHRVLETYVTESLGNGYISQKARFFAFSKEWDIFLDQHIASLGDEVQLLFDGRTRSFTSRLADDQGTKLTIPFYLLRQLSN